MNDDAVREVFQKMVWSRQCSVDDILETPELREEYLKEIRARVDVYSERELLHRLVYLRKNRKLPRSREAIAP